MEGVIPSNGVSSIANLPFMTGLNNCTWFESGKQKRPFQRDVIRAPLISIMLNFLKRNMDLH